MEPEAQIVLSPYRFDVDEYHRMGDAGILTQGSRVELLDGQIVSRMVIGSRHAWCVMALNRTLSRHVPDDVLVGIQGPVRLDRYSEPEPDISLISGPLSRYTHRLPTAADTFLVVEVADTSLEHDRRIKLPLYAAAGIPEFWIVDLTTNAVELHREPEGNTYRLCERVSGGTISPLAFPELQIDLAEVLPEAARD